ncbi:mitochondrial peptide methionine sulfoxide reductase isoform X1 [Rousettus aegyptiacus]|nr:mitochondrial peptide methionine sulfoxide reductase isoform X1 [Rousettus aegyptiacus]
MTGQISPALCLYLGRPCPFSASLDSDSGRKQQSLCGGALFLSTPLKLGKDALKGEATHSAAWSQGSAVPRHTPLRTPQTGSREQLLMDISAKHHVNGNSTVEPFPEGTQMALFGMGCFWGAERKFWTLKGVYSTQVGFAGGYTSNPTYKEVCSGKTGHAEVVRVVYQPEHISFEELLKVFWENHDPTQGMRQGNDHGSQYRSAIYPLSTTQMEAALSSKDDYQKVHNKVPQTGWLEQLKCIPHSSGGWESPPGGCEKRICSRPLPLACGWSSSPSVSSHHLPSMHVHFCVQISPF